mmetsp:Transcript_17436/g.54267  ORF Transcript_17436/g.54267 Transcript_17436/m.54267 type:complete len:301 (-) Transcript_17436:293-1195(-)
MLLLILSKAHAIMGTPLPMETHYSVERAKIEAFKARLQAARSDDVGLSPEAQRRLLDAILLRFKEIPPTIIHRERQTRSSGPVRGTTGLELVEAKSALQLAQDRVSQLDESEAPPEMTPPTCPLNPAPLLADGQPLSATALDGFLGNHKTKENLIILFQYALDAISACWRSNCPNVDSVKDWARLMQYAFELRAAPMLECQEALMTAVARHAFGNVQGKPSTQALVITAERRDGLRRARAQSTDAAAPTPCLPRPAAHAAAGPSQFLAVHIDGSRAANVVQNCRCSLLGRHQITSHSSVQ